MALLISYAVLRESDHVFLLRNTCPDKGVRVNLLHTVQNAALCP